MLDPVLCSILVLGGSAAGFGWAYKFYKDTLKLPESMILEGGDPSVSLLGNKDDGEDQPGMTLEQQDQQLARVVKAIQDGSRGFLESERYYMGVFMVLMSITLVVFLGATSGEWGDAILTMIAFNVGSVTSILSGWIGMWIAVQANVRVAVSAYHAPGSFSEPFSAAFKAGAVMGFSLVSLAIVNLYVLVSIYQAIFATDEPSTLHSSRMYEAIAGYGLGGSSIALFGRVGGGIFTKAADVGADQIKLDGLNEDDPRNPAVIADNVGDNVGDVAGMGADLFGSFAESSCAAMVVSATSPDLHQDWSVMCFPMIIAAAGIVVCLITSLFATQCGKPQQGSQVEAVLKKQLLISTVLMTPVALLLSIAVFPATFQVSTVENCKNWYIFLCVASGLWSGLAIGYITEYYTSNAHPPTVEVYEQSKSGAAFNIIHGLALGYQSAIIPVFCLAFTIYVSYSLAGMYGVACGAIGILSTLCIGLTIDAYGPICDNGGGLAEMAHMPEEVREVTDLLDAAGNTTAAIGKGFAIGSAAMVSLALFGAFVTSISPDEIPVVDILDAWVFSGLLVGAMLPYWFSAMTMKSVGKAAAKMVDEVKRQFRELNLLDPVDPGVPEYRQCVKISTDESLREMIPPGALVILTPLICGYLFSVKCLAGLLAGVLVSGVQMAISSSNSGGAWDNAKKHAEALKEKGTAVHHATVIGDTVGDPMKDTSGPSLNILIKLTAITSLVFGPSMASSWDSPGLIQQLFELF